MLKIPVKDGCEVGEFHYKVEVGKEANDELKSNLNFGTHNQPLRRLRVTDEFGEEQFHSTFIHELMEAVDDVLVTPNLKHEQLTNVAHGIAQALKSLGIQFVYE